MRETLKFIVAAAALAVALLADRADSQTTRLGDLVDASSEFEKVGPVHFLASELERFDASTGQGLIRWERYHRVPALSFNKLDTGLRRAESTEFPASQYPRDPSLAFSITPLSDRAVRVRFASRDAPMGDGGSLMLDGPLAAGGDWEVTEREGAVEYRSPAMVVQIERNPWRLTLRNADGRVCFSTRAQGEPASFSAPPAFSFVRRENDLGRSFAFASELKHNERLYGCGESFTRLDKRGQKVIAMTRDALGAQSQRMYKPIPFYLSSRGYGVFVHTSAPITFDFGHDFDATNVAYVGDEQLDVVLFVGDPQQVLSEYTAVTGRSPTPPLWSFGLWMSRITYKSEEETRGVAARMRKERIPCDVIHLDTGWFEEDWQCDFEFSQSRFPNPKEMLADLSDQGFRVSLWQLPYITPQNRLYEEALQQGLFVKNRGGHLPAVGGVLDFSNPATVEWYGKKLTGLLDLGVAAIKVDFGEDAPLEGLYASGRTGWYERNLYPLRYNRLVSNLTEGLTGERIIWARSAWAGSQRYPLHWGGDAENTYAAMAASLRAGLSIGLSGFTYWSNDAGGFVEAAPRELYARWLAMGALMSHTRCHGAPPREPWAYDPEFVKLFRRIVEMRYRLMPYILTQARLSSQRGWPLVRPLFFHFADDPTSWTVEDQFMLGEHILVAPLFDEGDGRSVYLPPGEWVDYQTGSAYAGGAWRNIRAGNLPIVVLVRSGAAVPHAAVAQHTGAIDWTKLELVSFGKSAGGFTAQVATPNGTLLQLQTAMDSANRPVIEQQPDSTEIEWTWREHPGASTATDGSLPTR